MTLKMFLVNNFPEIIRKPVSDLSQADLIGYAEEILSQPAHSFSQDKLEELSRLKNEEQDSLDFGE